MKIFCAVIVMGTVAATMLAAGCGSGNGGNDTVDDTDGDVPTDNGDLDGIDPSQFTIRKPAANALECTIEMGGGSYFLSQMDFVCRIANDALNADIYMQTNPTDCGQFGNPTYGTTGAWINIAGAVHPIPGGYDYGGRHHNDSVNFTYDGTKYHIAHSSIGIGWRACTTPDCLIVCKPGMDCPVCELGTACAADTEGMVATNGCARTAGSPPPPLPVICVQVNADGTVPEFQDPWTTLSPWGENGEMVLPCIQEDSMFPGADGPSPE